MQLKMTIKTNIFMFDDILMNRLLPPSDSQLTAISEGEISNI